MTTALESILEERRRQSEKWGEQNHPSDTWMLILGEEYGEACEAALHDKFGGKAAGTFRDEMVQVAAVAMQIIEFLDRSNYVGRTSYPGCRCTAEKFYDDCPKHGNPAPMVPDEGCPVCGGTGYRIGLAAIGGTPRSLPCWKCNGPKQDKEL